VTWSWGGVTTLQTASDGTTFWSVAGQTVSSEGRSTMYSMSAQQLSEQTTLLTITEVARRVRLHPRSVKAWITSGQLPYVRVNEGQRGERISEVALAAFLEARTERRGSK
jgi:excisionase family DNA binding protein